MRWDPAAAPEIDRAFWRVGAGLAVANIGGALLVFAYLAVFSPLPDDITEAERRHAIAVNAWSVLLYVVAATALSAWQGRRRLVRAGVWAAENRRPAPHEVDDVLLLPRSLLAVPIGCWTSAALLFGPLQIVLDVPWVVAVRVAIAIVLAGAMSCALAYLVTERLLRPVAAMVLAFGVPDEPRAPGVLPRVVISWLFGSAIPLLAVGLTQVLRTPGERQRILGAIWFLVAVGTATGAVAIVAAAKSVAEPVGALRAAVRAVRDGRLDVRVDVDDASEVGQLQAGFNEMVVGLAERRRLQDLFGRHVGEDVARLALERGVAMGGEQREVSVLFVDVRDSTGFAERQPADEVVAMLNRFFEAVVESAAAEGGWVNKFAGDGALCVFGAPVELPDHASAALRAARALRERLATSLDGVDAGIGVSSGLVAAGNVGARERYEYTVIGDPVNEAARLTDLAKSHASRALASEAAVGAADAGEAARWRLDGEHVVRGKTTPTRVYAAR